MLYYVVVVNLGESFKEKLKPEKSSQRGAEELHTGHRADSDQVPSQLQRQSRMIAEILDTQKTMSKRMDAL